MIASAASASCALRPLPLCTSEKSFDTVPLPAGVRVTVLALKSDGSVRVTLSAFSLFSTMLAPAVGVMSATTSPGPFDVTVAPP